jgi:hypothetical protein
MWASRTVAPKRITQRRKVVTTYRRGSKEMANQITFFGKGGMIDSIARK